MKVFLVFVRLVKSFWRGWLYLPEWVVFCLVFINGIYMAVGFNKHSYHLLLKSAFLSSEIQTWDDFSGPVTPTTPTTL